MKKKCILIVDDDAVIRQTLSEILGEHGYETLMAATGEQALEILDRGPAPDLILLDLLMPGMDGWAFRMRQLEVHCAAETPLVLLSANPHVQYHASAMQAVDYLKKPLSLEALVAAVEAHA